MSTIHTAIKDLDLLINAMGEELDNLALYADHVNNDATEMRIVGIRKLMELLADKLTEEAEEAQHVAQMDYVNGVKV